MGFLTNMVRTALLNNEVTPLISTVFKICGDNESKAEILNSIAPNMTLFLTI